MNIDVDLKLFNPFIITMNGSSVLYKYIKNDLTRFNDELSKLPESLKKFI